MTIRIEVTEEQVAAVLEALDYQLANDDLMDNSLVVVAQEASEIFLAAINEDVAALRLELAVVQQALSAAKRQQFGLDIDEELSGLIIEESDEGEPIW